MKNVEATYVINNSKKLNIIDIRDNISYKESHLKNAINITFEELKSKHNKYLNKKEEYYIYCYKGNSSITICNYLNNLKYNTINIIGGYESIKKLN